VRHHDPRTMSLRDAWATSQGSCRMQVLLSAVQTFTPASSVQAAPKALQFLLALAGWATAEVNAPWHDKERPW